MNKAFAVSALACLLLAGCSRNDGIGADIAFNFRCATPPSEAAIETFIAGQGFTVFNEERVRRQYKLHLYPLAIDGYDKNHRMLDFRGINEKPSDEPVATATIYSVGLYSHPPTHHDSKTEQATLDFVATKLRCAVSNVTHADNGPERAAFFDKVYRTEQTRIADGRRCDKQSGKALDTHCPS